MRIRNHVNPLRYVGIAYDAVPLPEEGEVEVELGCADAQFLFQRAAAHPGLTCVGVEIREDLVHEVNRKARELGLGNLSAVFANVNTDLECLFPDGRLDRVLVNFPDPWFKRRHRKRRVLTPEVAELIRRKLVVGGLLVFQSDVFELALDAMAVLEACEGLRNSAGEWSFLKGNHRLGARTLREDRCAEKGLSIWRMVYERAA